MSLNAYVRTTRAAETPQQAEERALRLANLKLRRAAEQQVTGPELVEALHFNRMVWQTFSDDCALPGNQLAPQTRAAIVSLGLWVGRHSSEVAAGRETVTPLIEVNSLIMDGLTGARQ